MSNNQEPAASVVPPNEFIDPFDFRATPERYDATRSLLNSEYIGDQLSENPDRDIFLESKVGGKLLTKEEYLENELVYIVKIKQSDNLPQSAKAYFDNSESFNAIFTDLDEASDQEILDRTEKFILEHGRYCQERLAGFQERIAKYREEFEQKIRAAVDNGDLPAQAANNLALLDKISISITDNIFSDSDPDAMLGGYYSSRRQNIGISIFLPENDLKATFFHEAFHAIAGHTIVKKYGMFTEVEREGFPEQKSEEWAAWLNEAITEHLTESLIHGRFDLIRPHQRAEAGLDHESAGIYYHERHMFSFMVDPEITKLTLNDFLKVYFSHKKQGDYEYANALRQLVRKISETSFTHLMRGTNQVINRWKAGESPEEIFNSYEQD